MIEDGDPSLGVHGHAEYFAEIHVGRVLQELRIRIPRNFWRIHHGRGTLGRSLLRNHLGLTPFSKTGTRERERAASD